MATKKQKSLIKDRNGTWYLWFVFKGKRIRETTGIPVGTREAKELAEQLAAKKYHELFMGVKLGVYKHTWEEACLRYYKNRMRKYKVQLAENPNDEIVIKRVENAKKDILQRFDIVAPILDGKDIAEISQQDIMDVIDLLDERGIADSTVNRYLNQYRATLNLCHTHWENEDKSPWLDKVPRIQMAQEPAPAVVSITQRQLNDIYQKLPPVHQDLFVVALETGLRATPIRLMKKSWLDIENRLVTIKGANQKNGRWIEVPLNDAAMTAILRACNRQPESEYVFATKSGKPQFKVSDKNWYKALSEANTDGFKWHYLRHLFVINHIAKGTPESVIMALGGWKTRSMIDRYGYTEGRKHARYVENVVTNVAQLADYRERKVG